MTLTFHISIIMQCAKLAVESAVAMSDKKVRVVSMPSTDAFDTQDKAYQDSVLTPGVKRVAIEAHLFSCSFHGRQILS
jgi:transketolase